MKTKAEIVQRLLDEKKIDAEEAVILLMDKGEIHYISYPVYPYPLLPYTPVYPTWPYSPITVSFGTAGAINYGQTFTNILN